MKKGRNPNAAEIAPPPLNAFLVQSEFREKEKINDLVVVMISISIFMFQHPKQKQSRASASVMKKNRNPNSAEIASPLNVFLAQSGFMKKEKINDLVAAIINISIFIPAPKIKINTHLSIRLWKRPIWIGPWSGDRSGAFPI